jgi:hypothetical protein
MFNATKKEKFFGAEHEDFFIRMYIPEKHGTYVDVGGGNPILFSNSYYFYRKGFSGLVIEPLSKNKKLWKIFRRRDIFKRLAVNQENKETLFYEFYPSELSTISEESMRKTVETRSGKLMSTYLISSKKLSEFNLIASPSQPCFISIDTEGRDIDVLKSNNFVKFRPRVIVVEDWDLNQSVHKNSKIKEFLEEKNYSMRAWTGNSCIYVHKEYLNSLKNNTKKS